MAFDPIEMDGFDNYTVGLQRWTLGSALTSSSERSRHSWGQGGENTGFSGIGYPWIELPQVGSLVWEGAMNLRIFNTGDPVAVKIGKLGVTSGNHIDIRLSDSKHPYIVHSQSGTVLLGPTTGPEKVIELQNWYWWQLYVLPHASAGVVHFAVNGSTWLQGTGLNTKHPSFDALIDSFSLAHGAFNTWYYDDFVWQDGTTGEFQGAGMAVIGKRAESDGAETDFTPNTGTSPEAVDEIAADDDTTYDASSTVGHRSTYIIADITEVPGNSTVLGVQGAWRHRKTEPGTRAARHILRVGSDEVQGPQRFPSETSYLTTIEACHILQPDGVSAWGDVDAFNALDVEIGQEITS